MTPAAATQPTEVAGSELRTRALGWRSVAGIAVVAAALAVAIWRAPLSRTEVGVRIRHAHLGGLGAGPALSLVLLDRGITYGSVVVTGLVSLLWLRGVQPRGRAGLSGSGAAGTGGGPPPTGWPRPWPRPEPPRRRCRPRHGRGRLSASARSGRARSPRRR